MKHLRIALPCVLLALLAPGAPPDAAQLPPMDSNPPMVLVGPTMRTSAFPLPPGVQDALRTKQWAVASKALVAMKPEDLPGSHKGDWAFLTAWTLAKAGTPKAALPYLPLLADADCVPLSYGDLVTGEVLRDAGKPEDALAALAKVDQASAIWPRAEVERAEVLKDLGRTKDTWDIYDQLAAQPDPSPGVSVALLSLAVRDGAGSPDAYPRLRRIWIEYPDSDEAAQAATLLSTNYPKQKATWQEATQRAENLADLSDWSGAVALLDPHVTEATGATIDDCRFLYVRGRSMYKLNKLTASIAAFGDAGTRCKATDGDYGPKAMYLVGQAQYRLNQYAESAATNVALADTYPTSSYADDGLTQAGFAYTEAGDLDSARAVWKRDLDGTLAGAAPGDTVPEATFRLAFAQYLAGKPDDAREIAGKLGSMQLGPGWVDIAAGRYWAARWALYPDVAHPNTPVDDRARKQEAIDGWTKLCEDLPQSFYAIEAYSRLVEVAPDVAAKLAVRDPNRDKGDPTVPWVVRLQFYEDPHLRAGVDLARLGLITEASAEWALADDSQFTGDEKAWLTELRINDGDWLAAHDNMRKWLMSHPPGTLGEEQPEVLRLAYPDRYWAEVQKNAQGYEFEPRLFHALCREESNFNIHIVSFAGAHGLSQLMPETAREVAQWMHVSIDTSKLDDPDLNAKLGARYLEQMHKQLGGSPYLSLAAYNAGAGRIGEWLGDWGDVPTDEFVERIPFRETRAYVKRVMGSWETMRYQFDDGPGFYDLSAFNEHAMKPPVSP